MARSFANRSSAALRCANNTASTSVKSVTVIIASWAPATRCIIGTAASPKRPMPKVVAKMISVDATNAPAIPKAGGQRAVSHKSSGSTNAPGLNETHEPVVCLMV